MNTETFTQAIKGICDVVTEIAISQAAANLGYFSKEFSKAKAAFNSWLDCWLREKLKQIPYEQITAQQLEQLDQKLLDHSATINESDKCIKSEIIEDVARVFGCVALTDDKSCVDTEKTKQQLGEKLQNVICSRDRHVITLDSIVEIEPIKVITGLLNRTEVYALQLTDKNNVVIPCFIKVLKISPHECRVDYPNQAVNCAERFVLEQMNILFWLRRLLPTAFNYGFHEHRDRETGDIYYIIVSQNIPGPACNQDGMAIDSLIKSETNSSFMSSGRVVETENMRAAKSAKEDLLELIFRTINEFSLFGTYFLETSETREDKALKSKLELHFPGQVDYYKQKITNYAILVYLRNCFGTKVDKSVIEEVAARYSQESKIDCSVLPQDAKKDIESIKSLIDELFKATQEEESPIKEALRKPAYRRYVIGDEFLLNFKIGSFRERESTARPAYTNKAAVFDADHCMLGNVLLSFVKAIADVSINGAFSGEFDDLFKRNTSLNTPNAPQQDVEEYESSFDLLKKGILTEKQIKYDDQDISKTKLEAHSLQWLLDNSGEVTPFAKVDFSLLFIYDAICTAGKSAFYELICPQKCTQITQRVESYSPGDSKVYAPEQNEFMGLLPSTVSYRYYSPEYCLPLTANMINAALTYLAKYQNSTEFGKAIQSPKALKALQRNITILSELFNKYLRPKTKPQ